jgi:hypothetical protein
VHELPSCRHSLGKDRCRGGVLDLCSGDNAHRHAPNALCLQARSQCEDVEWTPAELKIGKV